MNFCAALAGLMSLHAGPVFANPPLQHAGHEQPVVAAGADPLRDAGVPLADRERALATQGGSIAEAAWRAIEACDRCLAANDLAAVLASRPAAELEPLAPALAKACADESRPVIRAAAARALCAIPVDKRPAEARSLQPTELKLKCVPGLMAWEPKEFAAAPNALLHLHMDNPDSMQHNMLVVAPGALSEIGVAAEKMGEGLEGKRRQFVPDNPKVLFVMGLVAPGQSGDLWFFTPAKPGTYVLVCTYPGHYRMMNAKLKVK
jgi:uncharacterized cupredoxin-like copper-binding protein